ncbi:MAG: tetratricopeptide repeat protein, partial [Ktedonobacteraceae bacterium]|nr:tetratricopeptide repeat protein [Ktedonobacteraceae bacterium]
MSSMTESISTIEVFLSFAHEDIALQDELEKHLNVLKRQGQIKSWYNREISTKGEQALDVDAHIDKAQIILLLVSPDFMNSDYCYGLEMKRALERHKAGEARVIPIILRPAYWEDAPFSKLPILPTDKKPITRWPDLDEAFSTITRDIRNVIKELLTSYKIADGVTKYTEKRYEEALDAYEQAILLNPENALAHSGKGNALYCLKRYEEALAAYNQAILFDTENALTYYNIGTTLYYLKRYDEAIAAYEWTIVLDSNDAFAYNGKGNALRRLRRYAEALEACEKAVILDPDNALAHNSKGNILYDLKRYEQALTDYNQALLLDPENFVIHNNKGNAFRNLRRYNEALQAYDQALRLNPRSASTHYYKGRTLYNLRRYNEALAAYDQAIALDPNYAAAYVGKGTILYHLKRYKLALAAYDQAILLDPNYAAAYAGKGSIHYHSKQHKLALAAYEQVIRLAPGSASAYNSKGNARRGLRHYKAALDAYEQAIQLDPRFALAYSSKGDTLSDLKRYDEATRAYEQAIFLDPGNVSAYIGSGNALYHLKRYTEAVHMYEQATLLDPDNVLACTGKGNAFRGLRRLEEALEAYEQAILLNPAHTIAHKSKGDTLSDLKRYDEALAAYDQAILLANEDASIYLSRGNTLYELKRYEEALAAYDRTILLAPGNASAHYSKGLSLEKLKRHEEALTAYKQAFRLSPALESAGPQGLFARIKFVQEFLIKAGFSFSDAFDPFTLGFLALANTPLWRERFPSGLYVRILFDRILDQSTVQTIHHEAKTFSSYALVLIDQQPAISSWMAIAGLRLEEKAPFVFLPMAESLIKEGAALKKERQALSFYINKHLGSDFDPYDVRYPVSDAVSFFGRESLTDEIIHALKPGQSIGLFGLHKMGKSSVLQRLQKKAEFPTAYVYLSKGDTLEHIYKRILEGWLIDIRIKHPGLKWSLPEFTTHSDSRMFFDSAAKDLLMLLGSVTNAPLLAIFLDEIENIAPYQEGDEETLRLYINLMDSLRGLQQETNTLSLLLTGIHPIVARRNYLWG